MRKLLDSLLKNTTIRAVFLTILYAVCFFSFFSPIYDVNDDVFYTMIASGVYTKNPQAYIYAVNILIGNILAYLYTRWNFLNWYSLFLYSVGLVALFSLVRLVLKKGGSTIFLFTAVGSIFLITTRLFLYLTFTTIAAFTAISGIFLFFYLINNIKEQKHWFPVAFGLLLVSDLIRSDSFNLVIFLSLPLFVYSLKKQLIRKSGIVFMTLLFCCIIFSRNYHVVMYKSLSSWEREMQNHSLSFLFYAPAISNYDNNTEIYRSLSYSRNDYQMIYQFFYDNKQIFSTKKLQLLTKQVRKDAVQPLGKMIYIAVRSVTTFGAEIALLICYVLLFRRKNLYNPVVIFVSVMSLILIIFFSYRGYVPSRVVFSLYLYVFSLLLYTAPNNISINIHKLTFQKIVFYSTILALFWEILFSHIVNNRYNKLKTKYISLIVSRIPDKPNQLTYIWGSSIPYEWMSVFDSYSMWRNKNIIIGSWLTRTDYNDDIKKKFNINNLDTGLIENRNVYVIANQELKKILAVYMKEHYKKSIYFQQEYNFKRYYFDAELLRVYEN